MGLQFPAQSIQAKFSVGAWLSLVEHLPGGQGVAGSNPVAPTIFLYQEYLATGFEPVKQV